VERAGRLEVPSEWLLDHEAGPAGAPAQPRVSQPAHRRGERGGRERRVEGAVPGKPVAGLQLLDPAPEGRVIPRLARADRLEVQESLGPRADLPRLGRVHRLPRERPEGRVVHGGVAGDAEDRAPALREPLGPELEQRGQDLAARQVAGAPEDHEQAGLDRAFHRQSSRFTACPPNWWRSAASSRSAYDSASRERSRARSDRVITGAGTSSSTASATVQRPSPESSTKGAIPSS